MKIFQFIELFYRNMQNKESYQYRLKELHNALEAAEYVVIGAGSGLSDAAGLKYSGSRFTDNFGDFILRYGFSDLYTSSFYPFKTEEERWAYWARHIQLNRYNEVESDLYSLLLKMIKEKEYFVITSNVDGLFEKTGFEQDRIFAIQGDYAYLQCAKGCHNKLYYNESLIKEMSNKTENCRIPTSLIPHCPICNGAMDVNLRKDRYFVQDDNWDKKYEYYQNFMQKAYIGKTLLLELGVGYNTPTIIRFPFERMASQRKNITLARINRDYADKQTEINSFIPFNEEIRRVITDTIY
ncbi:MAG: SIR2 family NAD-dependent protein deacylase [Phocaeicola sp.]